MWTPTLVQGEMRGEESTPESDGTQGDEWTLMAVIVEYGSDKFPLKVAAGKILFRKKQQSLHFCELLFYLNDSPFFPNTCPSLKTSSLETGASQESFLPFDNKFQCCIHYTGLYTIVIPISVSATLSLSLSPPHRSLLSSCRSLSRSRTTR